jgi:hypothetical protein
VLTAFAATGVILSAVYLLWMFQKVMFGPNSNPKNQHLKDLSTRELAVFVPIIAAAFWLGVSPSTFLDKIDPAVQKTIGQFHAKYADDPDKGDTPRMLSKEAAAAALKPSIGAVGADALKGLKVLPSTVGTGAASPGGG